MSLATTTEEYRDILKAQRAMSRILERDDLKGAEGAQVVRALVDAVRLKRDMRGIPDPKPIDATLTRKQKRVGPGRPTPAQPPAPVQLASTPPVVAQPTDSAPTNVSGSASS